MICCRLWHVLPVRDCQVFPRDALELLPVHVLPVRDRQVFPGAGHLFQYVTNQSPKANSAFHPYGVGK